jgi:hypothetical protein
MVMEKYNALSSDVNKVYVSLHSNSHIRFSTGFVKKYQVKAGYMNAYYDGETNEVGFVFLDGYEEGALKVTKTSRSSALSSSLTGFININALEVDNKRYDNIRREGDMIIVELGGAQWTE